MSLTQAWQQALRSLTATHDSNPAPLPSAQAYTVLAQYLEPAGPSNCRFYDIEADAFVLDATASEALDTLLGSDKSVPSSSKTDLSSPSPILIALSHHYVEQCLQRLDQTALECGVVTAGDGTASCPALGDDLSGTLLKVSQWFRAWLSPYTLGSIFDGISNDRDRLLTSLQAYLRSHFDRRATEALRQRLEQLVADHSETDLDAAFVAHLNTAGLSSPALVLMTRVMHAEISRKVRAVVDAADVLPQDSVLPLESAARPVLQQWLDDEVKPRFAAIRQLCLQQSDGQEMRDTDSRNHGATWQSRLDYQLDKALCLTRAGQLFDLVALYPESTAALEDLRLSLQNADQRLSVAKTLSDSLHMRLLHPGAHTRDIIQMYVHLVRSLREVDPTGVVLSRVVSPLRRYLRGRKDTVLVIVASMLGDDPDFTLLKDELERADQEEERQEEQAEAKRRRRPRRSLQTTTAAAGPSANGKRSSKRRSAHSRRAAATTSYAASDSDASSEEDWDDPAWVPRPVEAGSGYRMSTSKDIISMLTSIFDARSGFIAALEKSMADQLVQVKGYKAMREYRNNMILKKRFGDKVTARCDVMLGDVTESRRIDSEVHQRRRQVAPSSTSAVEGMVSRLHPLIVSRQFWPENTIQPRNGVDAAPNSAAAVGGGGGAAAAAPAGTAASVAEFTLPPLFRHAQEEYGKTYCQSKAMRKLHWLNHLGTVELEVELDSGPTLSVECTLIQASTLEVISRCQSRTNRAAVDAAAAAGANVVTLTDVMEELNLQREADARDALEFWVRVGLLKNVQGLADAFLVQTSLPVAEAAPDDEQGGHDEPL